ncbi:XrtA/PEP-CTERM system histidine kinase PrsK [Neptunicella sp. SCSIO 80796]|uniref:XrtA/PEP-CTERM system histidine kinase PrsK n=1 Tax=Neptunicella plasticusilytica TaxID=3117012 RepID=UPI003A4E253D
MLAEVGYFISALGYFFFLLLLLTVRKAGLPKKLLILGISANFIAAAFYAASQWLPTSINLALVLESAKSLLWLIFITSCLKGNYQTLLDILKVPINLAIISIPAISLVLAIIPFTDVENILKWQYLLHTIMSLELLVLLETFYRQADQERWAYKPLILALGGMALFDFVLFSEASMINQIDPMLWSARGYIFAALIPFLVIAIRRIKHWGIDIFVSRDVVLHSSLLVVAGLYLFIMALAGYAIKMIGGNWSNVIQVVFIFLSLTLLAALLLSNQFRTKIKVFITKHFFANQFDYREEWLSLTQKLENSGDAATDFYQTATLSLMDAINCHSGMLIKFRDNDIQCLAQLEHDDLSQIDIELITQILPFIKQSQWIVDIEQLRSKPFEYEGLKVNHALLNGCSFQLILPVFQKDQLWGMVLIQDKDGKRLSLNWELRDYLKVVTTQVASYLFQHEASKELAENAQFAAFSRMSAFVLHDLKNVLAQIDLILCNAEQHKDNPEFIDDTFETLQHTKSRMEKMLRQLTDKKASVNEHLGPCVLSELIHNIVNRRCQTLKPTPSINIVKDQQLILDSDKLGNVLYHLINNAQQATDDNGTVSINLDVDNNQQLTIIEIADNGSGMSEDFIQNRLFKPFDTTKGNAGMGIGAYDAKNHIEKMGGRIEVSSRLGQGSSFRLFIPAQ